MSAPAGVWMLGAALTCGSLAAGCDAHTQFEPRLVARGELTLRYHDGVEIYAGRQPLTEAPSFDGLAYHVRCVARAVDHAEQAEADGAAAIGTGITGSVLGVAGLGGLAGLAFIDDPNKAKAFAILGSGVAVGLLGMTLALISRGYKNSANGHALDALNYFNDRVGVYGGTCDDPLPQLLAPPPAVTALPAAPRAPVPVEVRVPNRAQPLAAPAEPELQPAVDGAELPSVPPSAATPQRPSEAPPAPRLGPAPAPPR